MQMKRTLTCLSFVCLTQCAFAQVEDKAQTMGEAVVQAARVVNKMDGMVYYPAEVQMETSANGYSLLQKLALPNIRVDMVSHAVAAIDHRGDVQIRINGIVAGPQEMIALNPKDIFKVYFINNPGVRYGEGVAYVINIITRRARQGYTLGTDISPMLTSPRGNGTAYGKWSTGKNELSLSYDFNGYRSSGMQNVETARYTLHDGSTHVMQRNDLSVLQKLLAHHAKLTYNWADSTACVFQASMSSAFSHTPGNDRVKGIADGTSHYTATSRESGKSCSPVADVYFFRQITPRQSVTANAVGTYISTNSDNYYDEGTPYQYAVVGKSASLLSEVIYENRLRPFTLSAGANYSFKHTRNDYTGDAAALTDMKNSSLYAFGELRGMLNAFQYAVGAGASYISYRQNAHDYDYWTFRPKLTLAYGIARGMQLSYSVEMNDQVPRIAKISDAAIRSNSLEWTVGNPNLKPNRAWEHTLQLSYNDNRWQTSLSGFYRKCIKPTMDLYERTDDDRFICTQANQKEIDVLQIYAYAGYWIIPGKLQATLAGGMNRCFNYGNDYTHCRTSFFYQGFLAAYLGQFTLVAQVDNGSRFLEGENKGYNAGTNALQAAYSLRNWQFALTWLNPFSSKHIYYKSEVLNRNLHKSSTGYDKDSGNCLMLNVTWRFSRGKNRQTADKTIQLKDVDNGIIK